ILLNGTISMKKVISEVQEQRRTDMDTAKNAESRRAASLRTLRNGAAAVGTFVGLGSIPATEICARAGFEWLLIDLEHGAGGESVLNAQLHTAARSGALNLVRVSTPDRLPCPRARALGADGLTAPRPDTPEDVGARVRSP